MRIFALGVITLIFLLSSDSNACETDQDCPATSRCVRVFGERHGVCERGPAPIQGDPRRGADEGSSRKGMLGDACYDDGDCVRGLRCTAESSTRRRNCGY
jgi:hypothetical protein